MDWTISSMVQRENSLLVLIWSYYVGLNTLKPIKYSLFNKKVY